MIKHEDQHVSFRDAVREYGDVVGILIVGTAFGLVALFNWIKSTDKLIAATLAVLAVLAVAIFKDRLAARAMQDKIEQIRAEMLDTGHIARALRDGRPYHVTKQTTRWDLVKKDGSLVRVKRDKTLVFDQSDVAAIYDWASGDGHREYEYNPGEIVGKPFKLGRQMAHIVALQGVYSTGDHLDHELKRTVHKGFEDSCENVAVLTRDVTGLLRLEVLWPLGRPPREVRLITTTADQREKREKVTRDVTMEAGRNVYVKEITEPEKGGEIMIEWDW